MKIAVYSDIHGNLPGLKAVCREIDRIDGIDMEVCLGDMVYGGPWINEIFETLSNRRVRILRGNHDEDLAVFDSIVQTLPESHRESAREWNRWLMVRISDSFLDAIPAMPDCFRQNLPGDRSMLFCHAHPEDNRRKYLGPEIAPEQRDTVMKQMADDFLIAGHWHEPAQYRWGGKAIICPGSVGLRCDGQSRWLLIDSVGEAVSFSFRTASFDTEEFEKHAQMTSMPRVPESSVGGTDH